MIGGLRSWIVRQWRLPAALGIVVAAYCPGLNNGFVWLDHTEIIGGLRVSRSWPALLTAFTENDHGFVGYHRPFYNLLHSIDFALWGECAFGFHLTSLALHLLNIALLWRLFWRWEVPRDQAVVILLLWGVHPVNTAAVGLIHARADLLAMTALTAAAICVTNACGPDGGAKWSALAILWLLVGLLTKETVLMFPVAAAAIQWAYRSERKLWSRPCIAVVTIGWVACIFEIVRRSSSRAYFVSDIDLAERAGTFLTVYDDYVLRVILPNDLFVGDTVTQFSALGGGVQGVMAAATIVLVGLQILLWWNARWSRVWLAIWNLFLVPVSQLVPILHFRADRFLYLPSIGLVGLVVQVAYRSLGATFGERWHPRMAVALTVILVSAYATRTALRLHDFESDETLFGAELRNTPDYREGLSALALSYDRHGQHARADWFWRAALEPRRGRLSYLDEGASIANYGANLLEQHRYHDAIEFLEPRVEQIYELPTRLEAKYNLGVAEAHLGRFAASLPIAREYTQVHPSDPAAQLLRGRSAVMLGFYDEARVAFQRYLVLSPVGQDSGRVRAWLDQLPDGT